MVYLAQCLCPSRHAILAAASDTMTAAQVESSLRSQVRQWLTLGHIHAWCGLCGAGAETWTYEVDRTRYATLEEAAPALQHMEAAQVRTAAVLKALGLAYDPAPGSQN